MLQNVTSYNTLQMVTRYYKRLGRDSSVYLSVFTVSMGALWEWRPIGTLFESVIFSLFHCTCFLR